MTYRKLSPIAFFLVIIIGFQQCSKKDASGNSSTDPQLILPATPFSYNTSYPAHVQNALLLNDNNPADNPITDNGATLGRVLFYDKHLSKNNTISCGSCHAPANSFSDSAVFSKGFEAGLTNRHSMPLLNVRFYKSGKMFWDERAATLEKQVLQPIQNHVEMGLTLAELETKVAALSYYPSLFQKAFGSTNVDSVRISRALSQFVRSIVTFQSKYDLVKEGLATFTANESAGEQLFTAPAPGGAPSCAGCHTPPMFITSSPAAPFGLPDATDPGINNTGKFKVGSLRNIALTAPYFHNGSVASLNAMLAGGPPGSPTHIPAHSVAPPDVQKLLAFMQTLTDQTIVTEAKFLNPFH